MEKIFITQNSKQTKKLGEALAKEIRGGKIICLEGELGSGKTTFSQGLLKGLGLKGPYISPTFVIMKKYENNIFHFDTYRVNSEDILGLGWEEIIKNKDNIVIVEWADRILGIIPTDCLWIKFQWKGEKQREVVFTDLKPKS